MSALGGVVLGLPYQHLRELTVLAGVSRATLSFCNRSAAMDFVPPRHREGEYEWQSMT